jgi:alpha-tubulin suppressor-like RCC1 family protein
MPIVDVACGSAHSIALSEFGEVYVWGLNKHGQLGTGDRNQLYKPTSLGKQFTAKSVIASHNSSAVVTPSGRLLTWGSGAQYRLMQGHNGTIDRPTVVEALEGEIVDSFVFSTASSAVLVISQLKEVSTSFPLLMSLPDICLH